MAHPPLPRQSGNPFKAVHLCFFAVFLFSAFLTVYEALELKTRYEERQRAQLAEVQKNLDSQFQASVDELVYYEKMLSYALAHPLDSDNAREVVKRFALLRQQPQWQLQLDSPRSVPLNGVSDSWLARDPLLQRDPARINQELRAALEFSFILQFSDPDHDFHSRFWYISRAGFYISSRPPQSPQQQVQSYATMVQRDYFRALAPEQNANTRLRWTSGYQGLFNEGLMLTLSAPIISNGYWYGVLSMDFPQARIHQLMAQTRHTLLQGNLLFLDRKMNEVADLQAPDEQRLNAEQWQRLLNHMQHQSSGILRIGTQFASWSKLKNVEGYIINVQTLQQGMKQELGRVSLFLLAMWLLFVVMLVVAHQVIFRLVRRQEELSARLSWRANYDGLTRLLNRSAFFEQFMAQAAHCQQLQQPLSVIQLDVDHFKQANDNWGHHAGDQALIQVASVISHTLRKYDVAGRIGGEEFCILLPETRLEEATAVAERIRARLAAKTILVNASTTFNITLSAGVTSSEEQGDYHAESLQAKADSRLYLAKANGRNRVCSEG